MESGGRDLESSYDRRTMIRRGFADALPIIIGYVPMGAAYGILARQSGMGLFPTCFMSLIVFAGASQFIAVGLLAGGAARAPCRSSVSAIRPMGMSFSQPGIRSPTSSTSAVRV